MQFPFILIDRSAYLETTLKQIKAFENFQCLAICKTPKDGINKILELKPKVVFLSIANRINDKDSIAISLLSELHEFLEELPTIIVLSEVKEAAFEAYQRGVFGYLLLPVDCNELRKCLMRYHKSQRPHF